jgi:hypothetical protein
LQQIKNFDNKENMYKSLQMIRRGIWNGKSKKIKTNNFWNSE